MGAQPTQASIRGNSEWFRENQRYIDRQARIECYRNIRRSLELELPGIDRLLDIGNGGFFNYDTRLVTSVTAVDLFLDDGPGPIAHTTFRRGSLLALPFEDASFDGVVAQNVLHHVTGRTVAGNHSNLERGVSEIFRCLRADGKAILIESTVNRLFKAFERHVFRFVHNLTVGGHPMTFQFTPGDIVRACEGAGFAVEQLVYIPRGAWLLQFGYRWPSLLTPARPIKLVLRRERGLR